MNAKELYNYEKLSIHADFDTMLEACAIPVYTSLDVLLTHKPVFLFLFNFCLSYYIGGF